jgi:hypothetical protein
MVRTFMRASALSVPRPAQPHREEQSHTPDNEQDGHELARDQLLFCLHVEQPQDAGHDKEDSEHQPEPIQFEGKVLPRRLGAECNDAYAQKTHAPANVGKKSDADPDEEETPPGGIDHRGRDPSRFPGAILLTGIHGLPPFWTPTACRLSARRNQIQARHDN